MIKKVFVNKGEVYGKLTVIEESEIVVTTAGKNRRMVLCSCDCGAKKIIPLERLRFGVGLMCKACAIQKNRERNIKHGATDNRGYRDRLYKCWDNMKSRCYNKNDKSYNRYGGRGITVCDEWKDSYEHYREWALSNGYEENLTCDRINNEGNYEPSNCRWSTVKEQAQNRRSTITYKGECASDASTRLGGSLELVGGRIRSGWSTEKAFTVANTR